MTLFIETLMKDISKSCRINQRICIWWWKTESLPVEPSTKPSTVSSISLQQTHSYSLPKPKHLQELLKETSNVSMLTTTTKASPLFLLAWHPKRSIIRTQDRHIISRVLKMSSNSKRTWWLLIGAKICVGPKGEWLAMTARTSRSKLLKSQDTLRRKWNK